ncbi:MAG: MFS transporter [Candidatus Omnitrophica bacterium]|nr:MFS transporter [Candidatus Omnitrophota bacterium]MCM8823885.1 MFS transporter [Candidatus Omnitrophota bacterium]MCM8827027.1 MFS transporter [Candidatus Omnitrophota bacterium]
MPKLIFLFLCLQGAIVSFNLSACSALVPSIAKDFNISEFIVGKILWIYMLSYGISALFYGPLMRILNMRLMMLISLFFFSLTNLLGGLSQNINSLFILRFLMGVFGSSVVPLTIIYAGNSFPQDKRGRYIGMFFSFSFFSSLLGLFLSGFLFWRLIFIIPAIGGFFLYLAIYFYLPKMEMKREELMIKYLEVIGNKHLLSILLYIFLISMLYHGIQQWLGVYFSTQIMLNQFLVSMLLTLGSLSGIIGEAIGGYLSDRIGRLKTINLGVGLMLLCLLFFIFKSNLFFLSIVMFLWGLGWTFNHSGVSVFLADIPKDFLNEMASLNSGIRFISGSLGVSLGGLVMHKSFMLGFILFGIGLLGLLFFSQKLLANT